MLGQEKRKEIVEELLDNNLIVKHGFDPINISGGINWEYTHSHNQKTYAVYLHALEYVGYLVLAGVDSDNEKYYKSALEILESWIEADSEKNIEYSWNEHSVSYRLNNLILFQETVTKNFKLQDEKFDFMLQKHCEFLADEKNYKPNNHGILMDESLFKASFYVRDRTLNELYRNIALNRVKLALYRDFSRKGLHSENSPEYHRMMIIVLSRLNELMKDKNFSLTNDLNHKIKKAKTLLRILLKPDATYPLVGDTSLRVEENLKKDFSDFIDYETGIAIFQNENKKDKAKSDYLYFKCGYLSKTHKHFDDLSVNLMLAGNDIFIDSGKYSYNKADPIRSYIISPQAHTVPKIKGKSYYPTSPIVDQYNLGISLVKTEKDYKIVRGYNTLYEGCILTRTIVLTREGIVFINDEIESENEEILIQNFNINENAIINIRDNNVVEIEVNKTKYIMNVIQNDKVKAKKVKGYYSHQFSHYKENTHISYINQNDVNSSLIILHDDNKNPTNINFNKYVLTYDYEGKTFEIHL